jgi:CheY-like chemotaxis protein
MKSLSEDIIKTVFNKYKLIYEVDIEKDLATLVFKAEDTDLSEFPDECSSVDLELLIEQYRYEKLEINTSEVCPKYLICIINDTTDIKNMYRMGDFSFSETDHATFVSKMSHDIRTPMNALMGYVTLAGTKLGQPEVLANYLNKILESGKKTTQIIDDVMEMVRLSTNKVTIENKLHDMGSIVSDIKKTLEPMTDAKNQTFVMEADIKDSSILCDYSLLNKILLNLLNNAVKYTQENGDIAFKIFQKESSSAGKVKYEFIIQDNGYGMSEEFQVHMYDPFQREHNAAVSAIEGTGLGLTIAKMAVGLLHGTMDVSSILGEGTMITITLEFEKGDESANTAIVGISEYKGTAQNALKYATDSIMSGKVLEGKKILVAEDNEVNQDIIKEILEQLGAVVDITSNGLETFETIKNSYYGQYDVILMDVQMPVMDGNDATRRIRELSDGKLSQIPIVGVSANAFIEDRQKASEVGMNGYISKPIDIAELIGTLQGLL